MSTIVSADNTSPERPTRGRGVGQVAFLFGLSGRTELPGVVLRRMLGDLGTSPDASRTLLARMVRSGQLTSSHQGRTTSYALAGDFLAGWDRVRHQAMTRPQPWPGHFHAVLHSVPEGQRAYRDALRRAAVLAGYGTLQPGVLISLTDRRHALAPLANIPDGAHVRLVTLGLSEDDAAEAAAVAWDLPGLAEDYRSHIDRLDAEPGPGDLRGFVETFQPALTDTLREPALDPVLLPPDWPGPELRRAFGRFQQRHDDLVEAYLGNVLDGTAPTR